MAKKQLDLRALALSPLAGFRHEPVTVQEWQGATVTIREPSAGDWTTWQSKLAAMTGVEVTQDNVGELESGIDGNDRTLEATLLVRVLYDADGKRVFSDEDVAEVAAIYGPVHERLLRKAMDLAGLTQAPMEEAEKN